MDVATLAELLLETAQHHDHYEKTHPKHNWWDWYAPYPNARQNGSPPDEAAAAADRYMEEVLNILPRGHRPDLRYTNLPYPPSFEFHKRGDCGFDWLTLLAAVVCEVVTDGVLDDFSSHQEALF